MPHEPGPSAAEWTAGLDASERSGPGDANSRRRSGSIPQERGRPLRSTAPEDGSRPAAWSPYFSSSNMAGAWAQRVRIQSQVAEICDEIERRVAKGGGLLLMLTMPSV